jgi:YlmC/YmxH family sporulation protein
MGKCYFYTLREKEVINICDGRRFGYVCDLEIDPVCGTVCALIVPGEFRCFGLARTNDYVIPWSCIEQIGGDIILVRVTNLIPREKPQNSKRKSK